MSDSAGLGGVREESALLVEALRGFAGWSGRASGSSSRSASGHGAAMPDGSPAQGQETSGPCHACGCPAPHACAGCPVCRSAATLRSIAPSALEQMADLALMVADSLRVAAHARRDGTSGTTSHPSAPSTPPHTPPDTPPDKGAAP